MKAWLEENSSHGQADYVAPIQHFLLKINHPQEIFSPNATKLYSVQKTFRL